MSRPRTVRLLSKLTGEAGGEGYNVSGSQRGGVVRNAAGESSTGVPDVQ